MSRLPLSLFGLFIVVPVLLQAQHLEVMTYNIRYDNPADGENSWAHRKEGLAGLIAMHQPDVFGIQEGLQHQVAYLDSTLAGYAYIGVGRTNGYTEGEYCAIFYKEDRFSLVMDGTLWLSDTPDRPSTGWDAALPRILTWGGLQEIATGNMLGVINTHFDHQGEEARKQSARLIASQVQSLKAMGFQQVVVMGDFNATPEEEPMKYLEFRLKDTYDDTERMPLGPEGTWCSWNVLEELPTRRIDYIWMTESMDAIQYATLAHAHDGRYYSDHLPVWVRFRW